MARELVWRENNTFTAWGCGACNWVLAKPGKKNLSQTINTSKGSV
jgi:hypothetical protein